MAELKLKQLQYESDSWKRILGFMIDENIHLKNRLSEVLREGFDRSLLNEMENFQSRFIKEDNVISLLRNEMAEFDKLLLREIFEDGNIKKEVLRQFKKIGDSIKNGEEEFRKLKSEFNSYLSESV